jgi:glycosyltransferase involved in cell wall biosynthesis
VKIAYVAAGAAGMYCGSCLHDNALASALIDKNHDVALIPTYTPMRTDDRDVSLEPVFYGAVNVYLQQKFPFFRSSPAFLDRLLNRPGLLRWVSRFAGSTDAKQLGALSLSVLKAEEGHQSKELQRLLEFVDLYEPDLVQLTNAMFLGIGGAIRQELEVPVVCGLTGEDLFLTEMTDEYSDEVRQELVFRAAQVDAFIATSRYYASEMTTLLQIPSDRMHVVPLGINLDDFDPVLDAEVDSASITIGYLARLCPEKGLHLLCDAFDQLRRQSGGDRYKLRVAGYLGSRDKPYLEEQLEKLSPWIADGSAEFLGEVDRSQKVALLSDVDVLSVPTTYQEPKGLFVLEAWAASTPVVQPNHGAFPELIENSGGGLLFQPNTSEALAAAIKTLGDNQFQRLELGRQGRRAVEQIYNDQAMARRTVAVYEHILSRSKDEAHHA